MEASSVDDPTDASRAAREPGEGSRYRVRLRNSDGSRTRTLNVAAPGEGDASAQALATAGEPWEVLEVKCLEESDSEGDLPVDWEDDNLALEGDPSLGSSPSLDASASLEPILQADDDDLPAPQAETRVGGWDPDRPATAPALDRIQASPVAEDVTEVASFDNELEDLFPMSQSRSSASPAGQVIETRTGANRFRVRIARGPGSIVWESRIEGESMEAALETTRSGLDESWDVLSVARDDEAAS